MPPNPSIMAPGPALLFVLVAGVPSIGADIMVGDGIIGNQSTYHVQSLPGNKTLSGAVIDQNNKISSNLPGSAAAAVATSSSTKSFVWNSLLSVIGALAY